MRWNRWIGLYLLLALLPAAAALAHDFWIEPQTFRPSVGETVPIVLRVGQDFTGTSQPLIPQWFTEYSATGPTGVQKVVGYVGDDPAGSFTPDAPGDWMIGYRSTQAFVEIEPVKFNTYLDAEGLEWVRTVREQRGEANSNARELYSRCAKSLVRVGQELEKSGWLGRAWRALTGGAGRAPQIFDQPLGYTLEIIPQRDPYALAVGDELPVRLLYEGEPLADILIIAFTAEEPTVRQSLRTDRDGRVSIRLATPGTWLVKGVHIIQLPDSQPDADWESFWASLTFRLDPA